MFKSSFIILTLHGHMAPSDIFYKTKMAFPNWHSLTTMLLLGVVVEEGIIYVAGGWDGSSQLSTFEKWV